MTFTSPNEKDSISITQTYHGHDWKNPSDLSRQRAVDFGMATGSPVYAVESGTVINVTYNAGGYVAIRRPSNAHNLLYVHMRDFKVSVGQRVKQGQLLGYIDAANHLHLAIQNKSGVAPHPDLMSLFDRSINFTTWHQSIKNIWFKNDKLDWSKFTKQNNSSKNNIKMDTVRVKKGWGLSNVAKAAGYSDWFEPSAWQKLYKLNPDLAQKYNASNYEQLNARIGPGDVLTVKLKAKPKTVVDDKKVKELEQKLKQEQKRAAQELANKIAEHEQKANSLIETISELEQELNEEQINSQQKIEKLESYKEINTELATEVSKLKNQLESVTTFQKEDLPEVSPDMRKAGKQAGLYIFLQIRSWLSKKLDNLPDPLEIATYYAISWVSLSLLLFGAEYARSQGFGVPDVGITVDQLFAALTGGYGVNILGYKLKEKNL